MYFVRAFIYEFPRDRSSDTGLAGGDKQDQRQWVGKP